MDEMNEGDEVFGMRKVNSIFRQRCWTRIADEFVLDTMSIEIISIVFVGSVDETRVRTQMTFLILEAFDNLETSPRHRQIVNDIERLVVEMDVSGTQKEACVDRLIQR